jgi:hypothetical protein
MSAHLVQLNEHLIDSIDTLRRILGERVSLSTFMAPDLRSIQVDRDQLRAALVDVATRARDGMPQGGRFLIETRNIVRDEHHSPTRPREYVQLSLAYSSVPYPFLAEAGGCIEHTVSFYFPARALPGSLKSKGRRSR